jgi:hypothetical protein
MAHPRRLALIAAGLAAAVAAAVVIALPSTASSQASLRVADRSPLKLAGRGFEADERVRIRVQVAGERTTRRVRASESGGFRAAFSGLHLEPCTAMTATATGGSGSRAKVTRVRRGCPPMRPGDEYREGG